MTTEDRRQLRSAGAYSHPRVRVDRFIVIAIFARGDTRNPIEMIEIPVDGFLKPAAKSIFGFQPAPRELSMCRARSADRAPDDR